MVCLYHFNFKKILPWLVLDQMSMNAVSDWLCHKHLPSFLHGSAWYVPTINYSLSDRHAIILTFPQFDMELKNVYYSEFKSGRDVERFRPPTLSSAESLDHTHAYSTWESHTQTWSCPCRSHREREVKFFRSFIPFRLLQAPSITKRRRCPQKKRNNTIMCSDDLCAHLPMFPTSIPHDI